MHSQQTREGVHAEVTRLLEQRRTERERYVRQDYLISKWRVAVFLPGIFVGWLAFKPHGISAWWLLVPVVAFVALVILHDRVLRKRDRASRAVAFYDQGLNRLENRWQGSGVSGHRFLDPNHPYAIDLDIFGPASLFELLCTARTRSGEECLASWLIAPADPSTIRARQIAVEELRSRLDLREDLALLGEEIRSAINPEALANWGVAPAALTSQPIRAVATVLGAGTLLALAAWALGAGILPFVILVVLGRTFEGVLRTRLRAVIETVDRPARDLGLLSGLLARLERETFQSPMLQELRRGLDTEGSPPSAQITKLETLIGYLEMRKSMLLALVAAMLLVSTQCAFAIEVWRRRNGPRLGNWIHIIGEFEALCALAGYAYENPGDPFPEIVESGICLEAEALAHPLLPFQEAVPNDLAFSDAIRLFMVSGSNMSGKSTLLRSLGVNVALGLAGAPVRARRLRLSVLHIGASIRTQDSLLSGVSRFYAEILRLRQIVGIANERPPVLFLLDEILHGTNSHDRRIGAEAVIRALLKQDAIGLVTTHDLALARIADEPGLGVVNVHLEDHMEDGKMTFDYHLRPGVVEKSNAIELMRAVGLEV